MGNPTSPEQPWPVRTVAMKIAEWVARLGEVWVEGQVTQLDRRGGATAFLTLRDPAADVSVRVTCRVRVTVLPFSVNWKRIENPAQVLYLGIGIVEEPMAFI